MRQSIRRVMTIGMLGFTLSGLLASVEARAPTPQPAAELTAIEQMCQSMGKMIEQQAQARDEGVPYLTLVKALRKVQQRTPAANTIERRANQFALDSLKLIYNSPGISPAVARQQAELLCLEKLEAAR